MTNEELSELYQALDRENQNKRLPKIVLEGFAEKYAALMGYDASPEDGLRITSLWDLEDSGFQSSFRQWYTRSQGDFYGIYPEEDGFLFSHPLNRANCDKVVNDTVEALLKDERIPPLLHLGSFLPKYFEGRYSASIIETLVEPVYTKLSQTWKPLLGLPVVVAGERVIPLMTSNYTTEASSTELANYEEKYYV